ncbi:CDP-alcohol phosphatidyltransferase family protein [Diaminobutyricibacter sp. McL0608]|uniref:CDP-alcohol phosphatidyltransferase family protein n=1 Tax=Leifsonia sp. McL0608 TaxID=3143537 RepID=UPI0031F31EA1
MKRVQSAPIVAAVAGSAAIALLWVFEPTWGWLAGIGYLLVSAALLIRGLQRRQATRFGAANVVTLVRSTLVGMITGAVVVSFTAQVPGALLIALTVPALALDAVDGWAARRTGTSSELGARFDMEVDAFLLLVLSAYVAQTMGGWVLAIGLMRYAFVAVGWILPWFNRRLPPRYWRKVVTAVQGIALTVAAAGLLPGIDVALVVVALGMLVESFGRDVVWLVRRRGDGLSREGSDRAFGVFQEEEHRAFRRRRHRLEPESPVEPGSIVVESVDDK